MVLNSYLCNKMFLKWCRRLKRFIIVALFIIFCLLAAMSINDAPDYYLSLFFSEVEDYSENGCQFPKLDPFDPSVLQYISKLESLNCPTVQHPALYLSFIDYDGLLRINQSELSKLKSRGFLNISCSYRTFDRAPGSDDEEIKYDRKQPLENPVHLEKDMVEVTCSRKRKTTDIIEDFYFNLHAHPSESHSMKLASKPNDKKLSVLFMAIDSLSYSMLRRHMPLTLDYVTRVMKMFMFESFNKVGDNTQPNMFPMLTGKRLYYEQRGMHSEFSKFVTLRKADSLPLIWKTFKQKGYTLVFNEDRPDISLFSYPFRGYSKKQFDYDYHSYWQAVQNDMVSYGVRAHETFCHRHKPVGDTFADINRRHMMKMNDMLQFFYSFFVCYSHENNGTEIEYADRIYMETFRDMFEGGYLNQTVVFFLSDHGHRFSALRRTLVGLLEERNPFFGIWFPEWFYKLHPNIRASLALNVNRLMTPFDVHETLMDIVNINYEGAQRQSTNRALSMLYEIPAERSCTKAGIPQHYCLCVHETPLNLSIPFLQNVAGSLVVHLNKMLGSFKQCHVITYREILRAERVDFNKKVKMGSRSAINGYFDKDDTKPALETMKVRLAVLTHPNDAIFESTLFGSTDSNVWIVDGAVQRLTAYGNTSLCVSDVLLRKYCTCR